MVNLYYSEDNSKIFLEVLVKHVVNLVAEKMCERDVISGSRDIYSEPYSSKVLNYKLL